MNRLARVVRSRFFLAGLCMVLEFVQLLGVFVFLYEIFLPVTVLGWIFYIGVLLYLINSDAIVESKIPWLIILCFFPVVGAFVYLLASSNKTSEKEFARYHKAEQAIRACLPQDETVMAQLAAQDACAHQQAHYLYEVAGTPCYSHTTTQYFPSGEAFFAALLEDLRAAKRFILMEYFIIEEGAMWDAIHAVLREKAAQGLAVYVLYDDLGCMRTLPEHYFETLGEEGIRALPTNRFTPILSHIHNNRDHRKITVIDGCVGYTGGINLADEYINAVEKCGHWKDSAVRLEGAAVRGLVMLFLTQWNSQSAEPIDPALAVKWTCPNVCGQGMVVPFGDAPAPLDEGHIGKAAYLNMIHGARTYLYITTPYLICDRELLNALRIAAKKGVDVRILTPHIPDKKTVFLMTRSNHRLLLEDGVKIYEYTPGFVHAKNLICDDVLAICSTINMDYRSFVHHFECGVWMYDTACIADMKDDFLRTLAVSEPISAEAATLKRGQRLLAEVMKVFAPLF